MRDHLYLFLFMIEFSTGCILSNELQIIEITGYTGGSVVLPCSCAHPQSTAKTFTWQFFGNGERWIPVFEDEKYSGRRVLFNQSSPQNLSLLISGLRMEDEGYYKCVTEQYTSIQSIHLTVKGCNLVQNTEATIEVTGYAGGSVVLPCSCSELLTKPEQIRWVYFVENTFKEIYPNEKTERHKNRVKLLNQTSPGNLSLHISALTAEDEGYYYCSVSSQKVSYRLQTVSYRLRVEVTLGTEKPHIHTSISLSTHQPSHQTQELEPPQQPHHTPQYDFILLGVILSVLLLALLAFIYWRCRGGRNVKKVTRDEDELNREQDVMDDVTYSAVVYVKTAATPAHTESNPADHTEYAPIKVKR
ncbi:polymeric immunoglobulin receptor-like isoform X1 [Ctenopharyngodon idella]|uniref:polymeric immunoglobulin receptor-like isoform X1 n=1 Tax=Ctenopharyngodon idella TaxID=7959 RepID=UPI002231C321|nr:polymeric immunoglobulin receptor-like isoform X1 [Ctenopharyngodon idella]XP_051746911.1 polymeric immunoglobulin receptor-like isoform X1 [Ctenopharyngodon idella]XP_051746912.1 polymeric immunoglobulin receptor-like isoform X1 [Ctenopharyngodon idella]XP_051746913.1 polymeric immunoglobulin receptor-like isoform X1 [Ctenopharyngodon idella]XP_051746915.1 polymeric immunoglobulin receptor-like isoform X1 [Ctenopharyngodon idella]XP_051746916.1 polymeric immunoglobulin receptor-like isofor